MAQLCVVAKDAYKNDTYADEIRLRAENIDTILSLIMNTITKIYMQFAP